MLCVQLPSRLEVLTRLRAEKAEAAALRHDPLGSAIDSQQESLARLQALRQQQQQQQPGNAAPALAADADATTIGQPIGKEGSTAAAEPAADTTALNGSEEEAGSAAAENGAVADPFVDMNPRQRKLYELKQKMQQARKANENAIIAERKRQRVSLFVRYG